MVDFSRDSIINVIHNGIKQSIRVLLDHRCFGAAIILIYSGISTSPVKVSQPGFLYS
jgi:hypothetical protein